MGSIEGDVDYWPGGYPYVFQGTVAEDATAGTHVCTLTVTPGAGNEFEIIRGHVIVGNTATAQAVLVYITDGTNVLDYILNPPAFTTASQIASLVQPGTTQVAGASGWGGLGARKNIVSGIMQLILKVTTTAVSVTQTFAVVLRVRADAPTATLADTVGTPTLTTNTSKFF